MKKTIFTALSPNTQADDIKMALSSLLQPWRWRKGPYPEKLRQSLSDYLGIPNIFLFESGRTSLHTLLLALNLQAEDEVLLQSYTCVAVPEPILWVGAKPVYVDIDPKTLTMSPEDLKQKITEKSRVLIIQHTFGQPADLTALLNIANNNGLFVIEDCAHSLGSRYQGILTGTFGDAAFFSFGRDKVISSVFGGALAVKDPQLAKNITAQAYPYPRPAWIAQQLIHPPLLALAKATYRWYLGPLLLKLAKKLRLLSKAVYPEERQGAKPEFIGKKMPNALARLAYHQLKKLDSFNRHRKSLAKLYEEELKKLPLTLPPSVAQEPGSSIYLRYTLQTPEASTLLAKAKKEGIYLGDWYTTGMAPEDVNYEKIGYNPRECRVAEQVARQSFNLPTGIQINREDAQRIIKFLKTYYGHPASTD